MIGKIALESPVWLTKLKKKVLILENLNLYHKNSKESKAYYLRSKYTVQEKNYKITQ